MEETGLLNRESRNLTVTMEITLLIFTADEAKGNRQWDLQGPEGRLPSDRWETVSGHQTGYTMRIQHRIVVQAYNCNQYMKPVPAAANRTWANQPESAADPRQRQSAGKVLFDSFLGKKKKYFINTTVLRLRFSTVFRSSSMTGGASNLALANCCSLPRSPSWWTGPRSNRDSITQR